MTRTPTTAPSTGSPEHHAHSREIERDIDRTRSEMDRTLDEIGELLHPRHLFESVVDMFRAPEGESSARRHARDYAQQARSFGKRAAHEIKSHPIPMLLVGAGLTWLLVEELTGDEEEARERYGRWRSLPEYSGSFVDARTGESYGEEEYEVGIIPATWSEDYDWSHAQETREEWTERAQRMLNELKEALSDEGRTVEEKIRLAAGKAYSLSGRKESDLYAQWAALEKHDGALTGAHGEKLDETQRRECEDLMACDFIANKDWTEEEEKNWRPAGERTIKDVQQVLSDSSLTLEQKTRELASQIGKFVENTHGMRGTVTRWRESAKERFAKLGHDVRHGAVGMGQGARRRAGQIGESARHGMTRMGEEIRHRAESTRQRLSGGYSYSRDRFRESVEESPLAVGAAFLGLGLLSGLVLPRTQTEDRTVGEASDRLKERAQQMGEEAIERGRHVAEAATAAAKEEMGGTEGIKQQASSVAGSAMEAAKQESQREATEFRESQSQRPQP